MGESGTNPKANLWRDVGELPPSRFLLYVSGLDNDRPSVRLATYGRDFWDQGVPHYQDCHGHPLPDSFVVSKWCSVYEVVGDVDPSLIHGSDLAATFRLNDPTGNVFLICAVGESRYRFAEMGAAESPGFSIVGNAHLTLSSDQVASWVSLADLVPPDPVAVEWVQEMSTTNNEPAPLMRYGCDANRSRA